MRAMQASLDIVYNSFGYLYRARGLKVENKKLSSNAFGLWEGKAVALTADGRVEFVDRSMLWRDAIEGEPCIFGQFFGEGTLGVASSVAVAVEQWFMLGDTNFEVGLAHKQLVTQINLPPKPGIIPWPGIMKFTCGSALSYKTNRVQFVIAGEGMLVVRYKPPFSTERSGQGFEVRRSTRPSKVRSKRQLVGVR